MQKQFNLTFKGTTTDLETFACLENAVLKNKYVPINFDNMFEFKEKLSKVLRESIEQVYHDLQVQSDLTIEIEYKNVITNTCVLYKDVERMYHEQDWNLALNFIIRKTIDHVRQTERIL